MTGIEGKHRFPTLSFDFAQDDNVRSVVGETLVFMH